MITRSERFLAASIFILWSVGVMVLPALGAAGIINDLSANTEQSLLLAYFALHAIVLAYVVSALVAMLWGKRHRRRANYWLLALYAYAGVMLCLSMYFVAMHLLAI